MKIIVAIEENGEIHYRYGHGCVTDTVDVDQVDATAFGGTPTTIPGMVRATTTIDWSSCHQAAESPSFGGIPAAELNERHDSIERARRSLR